jgi:hypothetical protein
MGQTKEIDDEKDKTAKKSSASSLSLQSLPRPSSNAFLFLVAVVLLIGYDAFHRAGQPLAGQRIAPPVGGSGAMVVGVGEVSRRYEPSAAEVLWSKNIDVWQDKVCEMMASPEHRPMMERIIWLIVSQEVPGPPGGPAMTEFLDALAAADKDGLLSHMVYTYADGREVRVALEPLVGMLRDPRTSCEHHGASFPPPLEDHKTPHEMVELKPWVVLDPAIVTVAQVHGPKTHTALRQSPYRRALLFDMGGSRWNDVAGSRWISSKLAGMGLMFEHIYVWEMKLAIGKLYFEGADAEWMGRMHFFNWPVKGDVGDNDNPFTILKTIATPEDFVVVKLDIDFPPVETALVNQLLLDPSITSLVDEFSFEHHVYLPDMLKWWGTDVPGNLSFSYSIFRRLRELGVHAHSWP